MSRLVFDIETGPLHADKIKHLEPKFEAPKNYKDPEKIARNIEQQREQWYDRAALSPMTGEALAIGVKFEVRSSAKEKFCTQIMCQDGETIGEADLIQWFFESCEDKMQVIGFNSDRFDLPFLIKRAWVLGIDIPAWIDPLDKWKPFGNKSVDLMKLYQLGDRGDSVKLDTLARAMGFGGKNGSGEHFYKLFADRIEDALEYLKNDVELTFQVARRMGAI